MFPKSTITQEATFYWKDVNKFYKENGREPNKIQMMNLERKSCRSFTICENFKEKQASK